MNWIADPAHLRLAIFLGLLLALIVLERAFPRRRSPMQRSLRWPSNLGLVVVDSALLSLLPLAAIGTALIAQTRGWGLFNLLHLPLLLAGALAWLVLDCAIYWQHRALHEVRGLWPLHRVHHSDIEFDTTTALRFHPLEILLSMLWKMLVVLLLGAPPTVVLAFEIALNGFALWSHANLSYPPWLDRALRPLILTPDMHRIHHSVHRAETDSNYASVLTLWDRLFRSYRPQPLDGHGRMRIGIGEFRSEPEQGLGALLLQPLKK